jgi:hypothetical protein
VDRNNDIASTHSYAFDEKTPWNVIREVADACSTSDGAVGFDGYVDPAGNLWIFKRGSQTSTVDLTDKIIRYKVDYDVYRVKNKIKVYGGDAYNGYDWSDSLTNWTCEEGTMTLPGNYICVQENTSTHRAKFYRTVYPYTKLAGDKLQYPSSIETVNFTFQMTIGVSNQSFTVKLLAPDNSNYFYQTFTGFTLGLWIDKQLATGPDGGWSSSGSPDWGNITKIKFEASATPTGTYYVLLGGLKCLPLKTYGFAEDAASQGLYGVRMPEPTVDSSLTRDDDCAKKAQSLLNYYKDKVTTITLTTFGNNAFKPGDMLYINLPNDNISGSFRILEITHTLQDVFWQTELLLSNEPIMIDYIFRKMFEVQKTLASNK